jgi:hypothetical protein
LLVLQTFLVKKPCKKAADLHPRQGNLLQRNIFTGLSKTSLYITKQVGDQLKKFRHFFNMRLPVFTKISMDRNRKPVDPCRLDRFFAPFLPNRDPLKSDPGPML